MAADAAIERLTNLAFALQGAAHGPGSPDRSAAWIRTHVEGYQNRSDEAFLKQIHRDVATLQRAGVPIAQRSDDNGSVFRLDPEQYQLPEVDFTPEEAMVLGVAGGIGTPGGLSEYSLSGWTKIAAGGASRDLAGAPAYTAINDLTQLEPRTATAILTAVRNRLRIRFDYRPAPGSEPMRRTMDPWGLVNHNSRVYLVGYDIDRKAPRSFRMRNVSQVNRARSEAEFLEPTAALNTLVEQTLDRGERVDAVVRIPEHSAWELREVGTVNADGDVELTQVDRDWLVRTVAGYAPEVELLEPADLRDDIAALLARSMRRS